MILVSVSRSGGVAGISRRWSVMIREEDWEQLRSRAGVDPSSRDRFVYRVAHGRSSVEIPDSRLDERLRRLLSDRGEGREDSGEA